MKRKIRKDLEYSEEEITKANNERLRLISKKYSPKGLTLKEVESLKTVTELVSKMIPRVTVEDYKRIKWIKKNINFL